MSVLTEFRGQVTKLALPRRECQFGGSKLGFKGSGKFFCPELDLGAAVRFKQCGFVTHLRSLWGFPAALDNRDENGKLVVYTLDHKVEDEADDDIRTIIIRP